MNEIVPFTFDGAEVRGLTIGGKPWVVARDVCAALGIGNASDALSTVPDSEKGVATTDTLGGAQSVAIVNEPGLYRLVFRSRKPEAERFKTWIFEEVLPAIRKTGRYETPAAAPKLNMTEVKTELEILDLARSIGAMTSTETRYHGRMALARVGLVEPPSEPETRAESALRWMERHELGVGDTVSLRQIYQGLDGRTWCRRVTDAEDVVHELVRAGYLRKLPRSAPKRGRPPSPRFELVRPPRHLAVVPDGTVGAAS